MEHEIAEESLLRPSYRSRNKEDKPGGLLSASIWNEHVTESDVVLYHAVSNQLKSTVGTTSGNVAMCLEDMIRIIPNFHLLHFTFNTYDLEVSVILIEAWVIDL